MKFTACPALVRRPAAEPAGWVNAPPGNGLLSVTAGVRPLLFVLFETMLVVWLKPGCRLSGFVEYAPLTCSVEMAMGCTNMAKPERMGSLWLKREGVQAKPKRGPRRGEVFS